MCLSSAAQEAAPAPQDYLVQVWGADEGLPVNSVNDVAQTPEGYLWIGTVLAGVLRFDGCRFTSFSAANTPELRSLGVRHLMVDCAGRLWIALYNDCLASWDNQGFQLAMTNSARPISLLWSAPNRVVFVNLDGRLLCGQKAATDWTWEFVTLPNAGPPAQYCADSTGRVWYVARDQTVQTWSPGETGAPLVMRGLEGQRIRALVADTLGHIWVGTDEFLAQWQAERFEVVTPTNGEPKLAIKRLIPSGNGSLWVEANGRLRRCEERRWVAESPEWERHLGTVANLEFAHGDVSGGLWAAYGDLGLIRVQADGTFQRLTTRDGLPSNLVRFAFCDREGNVWTGYERGGLVQVRPRLFRVLGKQEAWEDALITTVSADAEGGIWLGTLSGNVAHYRAGHCTNLDLPARLRAANPTVAADALGRVWIAPHSLGLLAYEKGAFRQVVERHQLPGDVRLLLPSRDGQLWLGTLQTLFRVNDHGLTKVHEASNGSEFIAALEETADGTLWVGTFGGYLLRWNGTQFERFQPPARETLGRLWALCSSRDGGLWIGTSSGGLLHWHNGKFRRYTTREGLPSDAIVQVLTDEQGNLWMVTRAGVVRIQEAVLARFERGELETLQCSTYGRTDGLLTIGGSSELQPNCCRTKDGALWFAMVNSVAAVRPEEVRINPLPPTIALEEVNVDDKRVWPARASTVLAAVPLPAAPDQPRPAAVLTVGPGRRDLEFRYAGLSFGSPERVRFRYRLEGLDAGWIDGGNERRAVYRYVPPGHYQFRVMACNSDGVWNQQAAVLGVHVEPYFYQTAWFLGATGLVGASGLAFTVRTTTRRRLKRRLEHLERQRELERERTRIAQDLHDAMGVGLTEIGLLGDLAGATETTPEAHRDCTQQITNRARGLAELLDEIVWAVNPANDTSQSVVDYFSQHALHLLHKTNMRCRLEVLEPLPREGLNAEERHQLLLAFKEALNNVLRHSRASEVRLTLGVTDDAWVVRLTDNGIGFDVPGGVGSPDGLRGMRARLQRLGGRCEIISGAGKGTTVAFYLPVRKDRTA